MYFSSNKDVDGDVNNSKYFFHSMLRAPPRDPRILRPDGECLTRGKGSSASPQKDTTGNPSNRSGNQEGVGGNGELRRGGIDSPLPSPTLDPTN